MKASAVRRIEWAIVVAVLAGPALIAWSVGPPSAPEGRLTTQTITRATVSSDGRRLTVEVADPGACASFERLEAVPAGDELQVTAWYRTYNESKCAQPCTEKVERHSVALPVDASDLRITPPPARPISC